MKIPVAEDGDGEEVQAVERSVACLSALDLGVGLGLEQQVVAFVALVRKWGSGYVAGEEKVVMVHNLSLRGRGGYVPIGCDLHGTCLGSVTAPLRRG